MGSQTAEHVYEGEVEFPLIELSEENMKPGSEAWVSTRDAVRGALENHGGFLLVFHHIQQTLLQSIFTHSKQLFDLPTHTKKQPTGDHHGYIGQQPRYPLFETLAIDNPLSIQQRHNFARIMWPDEGNNAFCESVEAYAKGLAEVERMVKRMVCESYGVNWESLIESTTYVMRLYGYREAKEDEGDTGLGRHLDTSMITILHQNMAGLQVENKHGQWVTPHASPNLFCVVVGQAFMAWSNDRIRACPHRVIMKSKNPRYSVGLLSYSAQQVQIPEELVDEQHPKRYNPFNHQDFYDFSISEKGKKFIGTQIKTFCGV